MKIFLSITTLLLCSSVSYAVTQIAIAADSSEVSQQEEKLKVTARDTVPEPRKVMYRSLMVPGWGQITNQQTWKVPIVYGVIGGVVYGVFYLDERYQGYRAAYYNSFPDNTDQKFGPTPDFINPNLTQEGLRQQRNELRNNRDLAILISMLAYALNAIDAYVFAQFRDFDVSDDLSARLLPDTEISPVGEMYPTVSIQIRF